MFTIEDKCGQYNELDSIKVVPAEFDFAIICSEISAVCMRCGYDDLAGGLLYTVIKSNGEITDFCVPEDEKDDMNFQELMEYIGLGDIWVTEEDIIPNTLQRIVAVKVHNIDVTFSIVNDYDGVVR